jgi:predicted enzyme related to lactoylglutathione lyase
VGEPGTVGWSELACREPEVTKPFYAGVFGWRAQPSAIGDASYETFDGESGPVAGLTTMDERWPDTTPAHWMTYIVVADAGATAARTPRLGGIVSVDPFDVAGAGRIAVLTDPFGAHFSLLEPAEGSCAAGAALPARPEEVGQQGRALLRQQASRHGGAVVEPRLRKDVEDRAGRTRLRVGRAEDDARHAREHDRAGAHRARLERDVEHRVEHAPGAEHAAGLAQRDELGVCRRVLTQLALVVGGGDDLAVAHDDRADRDVVVVQRRLRLADRQAHEVLVARKKGGGHR